MTGEQLRNRAYELLSGLGDTPDAVAESLRAAGVKGRRISAFADPAATFLQRELAPEAPTVRVAVLLHLVHLYQVAGGPHVVTTPPAVAGFITAFDREAGLPGGRYADLVEVSP